MSRFLQAYEDLFSKSTDAPVEFGHASGLAVLSTIALGRRWVERGPSFIHSNLFFMLTAESSRHRKSTSVDLASDLIEKVEPERLGPSDFTGEGLISYMSGKFSGDNEKPKKTRKSKGSKDNPDPEPPEPEPEPKEQRTKFILPISEFGTYLAASGSYAKSLAPIMCDIYDGKTIRRVRATGETPPIKNPRISMIAGVAYGMLERYATETDWVTGFFARIIWMIPQTIREPYIIQPVTPVLEKNIVLDKLRDLNLLLRSTEDRGTMLIDPDAEPVYRKFAASIAEEKNEPQAVTAQRERLLNSIWKIAMIYQIDTDPMANIGAEATERACSLAYQAWNSFKIVNIRCGGAPNDRLANRIWRYVSDKKIISKRDLYRAMHIGPMLIGSLLDRLLHDKLIEQCGVGPEGKMVTGYRVVQEFEE